jgi:hypothetical protein
MVEARVFAVHRGDLRATEVRSVPLAPEGGAVLRVDHFALTANNVTYAAFGERMGYWSFFPLEEPWGCVPVWGFGTVVASDVDRLDLGERFYGYFPMASHLAVSPRDVGAAGFMDGAPHRMGLTAGYNQYVRTSADPMFATASEAHQMLLRPLFLTGFVIDDYLFDNGFFGAGRVILSSASSKTALAAAFLLSRRKCVEVVGLTSNRNTAALRGLGCYDRVLSYDELDAVPAAEPVCYVDMAASGALREAIHHRFGERLKLSCAVGATHWNRMHPAAPDLPGPRPQRFFVPTQVAKRVGEWGAERFQQTYLEAWKSFLERALDATAPWFDVKAAIGPKATTAAWLDLVEGRADGRCGRILSLP